MSSYSRYGVQQMNQSRDKPDIVITHIKDLGVNLNEKTVTIRGRLHTSRAKGELSLSPVTQLTGRVCREAVLHGDPAAAGHSPVSGLRQ